MATRSLQKTYDNNENIHENNCIEVCTWRTAGYLASRYHTYVKCIYFWVIDLEKAPFLTIIFLHLFQNTADICYGCALEVPCIFYYKEMEENVVVEYSMTNVAISNVFIKCFIN